MSLASAYLLLGTHEPEYRHRLVRLPLECLIGKIGCSPPEVVQAYPAQGVAPAQLHWSPNGSEALILDTYEPRVLRFDPPAGLTPVAVDLAAIADRLAWLPDGSPAFVIQGPSDFVSELVALTDFRTSPQVETLFRFDGIAVVLGLRSSGDLLIRLDRYGFPTGNPAEKKDVVDVTLWSLDPSDGTLTEVLPGVDWYTSRPEALLPGSDLLLAGMGQVDVWDLQEGTSTAVGSGVIWPTGSPDGRLLVFNTDGSGAGFRIQLLEVATGEVRPLASLPVSARPFWTADSRYVVLAGLGLETSEALGSLRVIDLENGLVIQPLVDFGEFPVVEYVSWGP